MPKLTIKKIESLIKRKEFGRHPDGNQLYLNIREPEGTASWVFRFTLHGKRPWHGFGAYDSHHGLQWAREQVLEFKALVKKGIDPRDHKREEQESARHVNNLNNNTFQKVAQCYIKENQASWRSEVTKKQWPNSLRDYVYPVIGSKPVHLITIHDVLSVLRPIWTNKTTTAIRVRSRIENILDYSTTLGMREGNNPAVWRGNLNTVLPAPTKVHKVKSHPAASYTELHDFLEELRARKGVGARALEFTILTGSRTRPLLLAKWEDIDLDNAIWNCPEDNMKSGKFFRIPLSGPAMKIINNQKKYSRGEYIFGHEQTGNMSSNNCMLYTIYRMGYKGKVTTHGMRSTLRDWAGETTKYSERIVEVCLDHTVNSAAEAAYQRGDYLAIRREIMDGWGRFCYPIVSKVIQLQGGSL
jgi:integrase